MTSTWLRPVTEEETHSRLDLLLGGGPRRVARHWLSLLVLSLAVLGAAAFFVRFVNGEDSPYYSAVVERSDFVPVMALRGELHVAGEFAVLAPRAGRIAWISDKTMGLVRKGEMLARIEADDDKNAVEIEESGVAAAQATLDAAQVAAQEAAARLARFEGVWRRSGGRAPSLNEMETARASVQRADLAVTAARAQAEGARLRLGTKRVEHARSEVRTDVGGVMVRRHVARGQSVNERQPLFTLSAGRAPLIVEVAFPSMPFGSPPAGTQAQVRMDTMPDEPQPARLSNLYTQSSSGKTIGQFVLDHADPRLSPGMAATVELNLPVRHGVLLVPDAALAFDPGIVTGQQPPSIYVLSDDGEPRRIAVTLGASDGKRTEVFGAGLKPGDRVVIGWRAPIAAPSPSRSGS